MKRNKLGEMLQIKACRTNLMIRCNKLEAMDGFNYKHRMAADFACL